VTYAKKIDANQPRIVLYLRARGATVQILSAVGKGCPDLLVGWQGRNHLLEAKAPKGKLTPDQVLWHAQWQGSVAIVRNEADCELLLRGEPRTEEPTASHRRPQRALQKIETTKSEKE